MRCDYECRDCNDDKCKAERRRLWFKHLVKSKVRDGAYSRHRAFAMRLVLGLLMATRDEFAKLSDLGLFQRAARRWLNVMEGKR